MPSRPSCEGGCGGSNADHKALERRLKEIDFCLTDVILYLDAYPNSKEALAYYHKLIAERARLTEQMGTAHPPVNGRENTSAEHWDWIRGPWPWEASAN